MVTLSYGNPTCKTKEFQFYHGSNGEPEKVLSRALTGCSEREGETKLKLTGNNVKNGLCGARVKNGRPVRKPCSRPSER